MALEGSPTVTPTAYELQEQYYDHFGGHNWDEYNFDQFISLKKKIAYAIYGPPSQDIDEGDSDDIGYGDKQMKTIKTIYEQIEQFKKYSCDGNRIYMTLLFTCCIPVDKKIKCDSINIIKYAHLKSDKMFTSPVFKIRKCIRTENSIGLPCCCYVDDHGRVYTNWNDYLKSNKMPEGVLIVPKDGLYSETRQGTDFKLNLDIVLSPASSTLNKALNVGNKVGTGIAVASTGVFLTALFAPVAAPVLIGAAISSAAVGAFGTTVSSLTLRDRSTHEQPINLSDSEARGCWINIGASSLAMISTASGRILSTAVGRGIDIGRIATTAHNGILIASVTANGLGIANGIHSLVVRYHNDGETPSSLELLQLSSSILFFCHSVVNVQTASRIIEETQVSQIELDRSALRSNRHRKIFDKMAGETRRRNGDIVKGNAEIIRSMRQITDKDSFFANALRMNKDLNRNNVKISFGNNGNVLLNGVHGVNPEVLSSLNSAQRSAYLSNIEPSQLSAPNAQTRITLTNPNTGVSTTIKLTLSSAVRVYNILNSSNSEIDTSIYNLIEMYGGYIFEELVDIAQNVFDSLLPNHIELLRGINIPLDEILGLILKKTAEFLLVDVQNGNLSEYIHELREKGLLQWIINFVKVSFISWLDNQQAFNARSHQCSVCGGLQY